MTRGWRVQKHSVSPLFIESQPLPPSVLLMNPVSVVMYSVLVLLGSTVTPSPGRGDSDIRDAIGLQLAPPFVVLNRVTLGTPALGFPAMYNVLALRGSSATGPSSIWVGIPTPACCQVVPP